MALNQKCCSAEVSYETAYKHMWRHWGNIYCFGECQQISGWQGSPFRIQRLIPGLFRAYQGF
jgi:hypothetical protein